MRWISKIWSIDFLIGLSIFISSYTFFTKPFEGYFHYIIFLFLLPFFITRYGFPSLPINFLILPAIFGIISLLLGNVELFPFIKIFGGMLLSVLFYNFVLIHYEFDISRLFKLYLDGIVFCCYIAIIQIISYRIGFKYGYNFNWIFNKWGLVTGSLVGVRVNSVFSEPAQFALMLMPAVFISLHNLILRKYELLSQKKSVLVIACLIFSLSSTGYFGLFISLVLLAIHYGRISNLIWISSIMSIGAYFLYRNVDEFRLRVDTSINLWTNQEYTIEDINSSSFVLYNNFHVATESFSENLLFGTGLGSFPQLYEKYSLTKAEDFIIKSGFDFNSQDGNSLFIRSMAEVGLIGVLFWIIFIPRFFIKRNPADPGDITWLYSSACLVIILGYLLRQGNYFLNGFPFFVLLYYYTKRISNRSKDDSVINRNHASEHPLN